MSIIYRECKKQILDTWLSENQQIAKQTFKFVDTMAAALIHGIRYNDIKEEVQFDISGPIIHIIFQYVRMYSKNVII